MEERVDGREREFYYDNEWLDILKKTNNKLKENILWQRNTDSQDGSEDTIYETCSDDNFLYQSSCGDLKVPLNFVATAPERSHPIQS